MKLRSLLAAAAAATGADAGGLLEKADARIAADPTWAVGLRPMLLELRATEPADRIAAYARVVAVIEE
jgi:hypothetical protein